jgi:8-oxo-dGTP pyrophosphatase MutT (NUDIX family)
MEKITYAGRIVEIVEFDVTQGGKNMVFEKARRSPGVRLIIPSGSRILLSREERHEIGGFDYRLPGGKVFDSLEEFHAGLAENPDLTAAAKAAALKEAREEVGLEVRDASFFHKSVCGTTVEWDLFYFVAGAFTETNQHLEDGEDISSEFIEIEKVRRMCLDGSINEERSALVLLRYLESLS